MRIPVLLEEGLDLSSNGKHKRKKRKRRHRVRNNILKTFLNGLEEPYLLPEQLSDENRRKPQPEKTMWLVLLQDAIDDYVNKDLTSPRKMRLANEAEEWFLSHEYFQGTFLWVCDVLDLDDSYIRQGVEKLRHKEGYVYKCEKGTQQYFLGEESFPAEKVIACIRSFNKIELWRDLSYNALRIKNLGCWRRLFAYALRALSKPKLSWNNIAEILGCNRNTAINLYYKAIMFHKHRDKQFMSTVEEFKKRMKDIETNERSLR